MRIVLGTFLLFANPVQAQTCFDLDHNGKVDFADFILFVQDYGDHGRYGRWDFLKFQKAFGKDEDCSKKGSYSIEYSEPIEYPILYPAPQVKDVYITPSSVRLSWEIDSTDKVIISYMIERSPHPMPRAYNRISQPAYVKTIPPDSTTFTIEPLLSETKYAIILYALYDGKGLPVGSDGNSTIEIITPAFSTPGPPVLVELGWFDEQTVLITWNNRPLVYKYLIFKDGWIYGWPQYIKKSEKTLLMLITELKCGINHQIKGHFVGGVRSITYKGDPLKLYRKCQFWEE